MHVILHRMSTTFQTRTAQPVPRSVIDPGLPEVAWDSDEPSDPVPPRPWVLYLEGISTRTTQVDLDDAGVLSVKVQTGACVEDLDLALGILRRAAEAGDGLVKSEEADTPFTLAEFEAAYGDEWKRRQLKSAADISIWMARREGIIALPGPTREVWIGPRVVEELENGDPAETGDRLVRVMRRVLWTEGPPFFAANRFRAGMGAESVTLAVLPPETRTLLPRCDQVGLKDAGGTFMVAQKALPALPLATTWLDDGNLLVEAVSGEQWAAVCQAARALQGTEAAGGAGSPPRQPEPPSAPDATGPSVTRRWRNGWRRGPR